MVRHPAVRFQGPGNTQKHPRNLGESPCSPYTQNLAYKPRLGGPSLFCGDVLPGSLPLPDLALDTCTHAAPCACVRTDTFDMNELENLEAIAV